ncbi:MAG: hypothetical protein PF542_03030 [Nanoarchaeota archaeon]|jgi:uncharacterized membrane protein|nr:hypothetical protein [Nanoarchaeota archaeon]
MKRLIAKEGEVHLIENMKKPIFVSGVVFWAVAFALIVGGFLLKFRTGYVVSSQVVGGMPMSIVMIGLFVVLAILLFIVWKLVIKSPVKKVV